MRQPNHPSATKSVNRHTVEQQILQEIANNRYVVTTHPPSIISALAAIPKPGTDEVRLIHDASRPYGNALNDYAEGTSFTCSSVQDAAQLLSRGDYMGKVDLSSAYRSVPLHPDDYSKAGLAWRFEGDAHDTYLYDTRLMFGARLSACIFNSLTKAVVDILIERGHLGHFIVYCDDFFVTHPTKEGCKDLMAELMSLLRTLGFSINYKKIIGPATEIVFLGVNINTVTYTLGLAAEKLYILVRDLNVVRKQRTLTYRKLQSLCGKLNWAAQVIYGGRVYLRRLLDAMKKVYHPNHHINVNSEMKKDLLWWAQIAGDFNGIMPIIDDRPTAPFSTDACLIGGGGYHNGEWYHLNFGKWPGVENHCINYKEVLAVLPAFHMWGYKWRNRKIACHIDNMAACHILRKGSCKDITVQHYLREMHTISARYNFRVTYYHYPGQYNVVADSLSRLASPNGFNILAAALNTVQSDPMNYDADTATHIRGTHTLINCTPPMPPHINIGESCVERGKQQQREGLQVTTTPNNTGSYTERTVRPSMGAANCGVHNTDATTHQTPINAHTKWHQSQAWTYRI